MSNELMRFSVAMPEDLLIEFDKLVARRGIAKNRSEVVRDLVRDALAAESSLVPGTDVLGTLTIIFNHHQSDLQDKLHDIEHDCFESFISTTHVHVDHDTCMEVIILRGESTVVQSIANRIIGTKGVRTGKLVLSVIGKVF